MEIFTTTIVDSLGTYTYCEVVSDSGVNYIFVFGGLTPNKYPVEPNDFSVHVV